MNKKLKRHAVGVLAAAALVLTQSPVSYAASADEIASQEINADPTYSRFVSNLKEAAASGDSVAAENLVALEDLTGVEKQRLADYLKGGAQAIFDNAVSGQQGDLRVSTVRQQERSSSGFADIYNISTQSYVTFINVKLIETRVRGGYEVRDGRVDNIFSHQCDVTRNYDPFAQITSEKDDSYISGNEATFLCHVTVKRGAPTPWGPISWSTREANQRLVGDAYGNVVDHGWV